MVPHCLSGRKQKPIVPFWGKKNRPICPPEWLRMVCPICPPYRPICPPKQGCFAQSVPLNKSNLLKKIRNLGGNTILGTIEHYSSLRISCCFRCRLCGVRAHRLSQVLGLPVAPPSQPGRSHTPANRQRLRRPSLCYGSMSDGLLSGA